MLGVISGHLFYSYNSPLKMEQCCVSIAFGANAVIVRLDILKDTACVGCYVQKE